jgi:hypothetical protein
MTKAAAIHNFFSSFGLTPYEVSSVPSDVVLPYLTYELTTGAWDDGEINITVNLWYYTESQTAPNAKAQEIAETIGRGGKLLAYDGGAIWLKRGSPWCQNLGDPADLMVKRRYINVTAEFLSEN